MGKLFTNIDFKKILSVKFFNFTKSYFVSLKKKTRGKKLFNIISCRYFYWLSVNQCMFWQELESLEESPILEVHNTVRKISFRLAFCEVRRSIASQASSVPSRRRSELSRLWDEKRGPSRQILRGESETFSFFSWSRLKCTSLLRHV